MTRFRRLSLFALVVLASIWTLAARPAAGQTPSKQKPSSTKADVITSANDSVTVDDVARAAQQLAAAVQEAVRKTTEDPAVKVAALNVAKNAVTAAQVVITQQAATIQTVLDGLAQEIAQAAEKQHEKGKNH